MNPHKRSLKVQDLEREMEWYRNRVEDTSTHPDLIPRYVNQIVELNDKYYKITGQKYKFKEVKYKDLPDEIA